MLQGNRISTLRALPDTVKHMAYAGEYEEAIARASAANLADRCVAVDDAHGQSSVNFRLLPRALSTG